jgi:hypothetical protein
MATEGFLGLEPENVVVRYRSAPERPGEDTLTVEIVNFESHLFAPGIGRALVSPRPVSVTAPMGLRPAPPEAAGSPQTAPPPEL